MTGPEQRAAPRRGPRRSPSPQERQRDPERTKGRILDAAVEVFSAKGYAGARVAEIADQAGVNKQLITYYFGGKAGLYREVGRRWRAYEARAFPDGVAFAELIKQYVRVSVDPRLGGRLLAWQGLADPGAEDPDAAERTARLRHEIADLRRRQRAGEVDPQLDPAALLLITMSAAHALTVYPHIARGLFDTPDAHDPQLVEHYADQLAEVVRKLGATRTAPPPGAAEGSALEQDGSR